MLQRVSFAVLLALVTTSCSTSTIEDPAVSVVTSAATTATQEDNALAEELLRTTSSVLQEWRIQHHRFCDCSIVDYLTCSFSSEQKVKIRGSGVLEKIHEISY